MVLAATARRTGLEIGGPSPVFRQGRLLPIYATAACIDNINFSNQTAWEKNLCEGGEFRFESGRRPGKQWIRDAVALTGIGEETYDFVLSSHCLEHVANPLVALREWRRVTRQGGHLVLILPDRERTFDHRRPLTTIQHLREDFARHTQEDDQTHVPEVLALHDLSRDPWAGSVASFHERTARNAENRCIHHHVFDIELMKAALTETGWHVLAVEKVRPVHLIAFAERWPRVD